MERKKRHESTAETDQQIERRSVERIGKSRVEERREDSDKEEGELDTTSEVIQSYTNKSHPPAEGNSRTRTKSGGSVDMNALDYEDHGSDREDRNDVSSIQFLLFLLLINFYLFLF